MPAPETLLVDAEQRAADHPGTFEIPDAETRSILAAGLRAKVILVGRDNNGSDRVWLEITRVSSDGTYTGRCLNTPVFTKTVKVGSIIHFSAKHIVDIDVPAGWKG